MKQQVITNNRKSPDNIARVNKKKPFDKKKYRLQRYSNKYKVNQWEERRKKAVLQQFYKEVNKDHRDLKAKQSYVKESCENREGSPKKQLSAFHVARGEYMKKKEENNNKKEEILKTKAQREEALKKYKVKKMQTFKKLSQKTKKGQPVMKGRIELLLEKIQHDVVT